MSKMTQSEVRKALDALELNAYRSLHSAFEEAREAARKTPIEHPSNIRFGGQVVLESDTFIGHIPISCSPSHLSVLKAIPKLKGR